MKIDLASFDPSQRPPRPEVIGMDPFVTGSYAYGTPTEESDIDLVIFMDERTKNFLSAFGDDCEHHESHYALRMGKLNLICCISERQYEAWREGTLELISQRPVTRDTAVEVLTRIREEYGIENLPEKK